MSSIPRHSYQLALMSLKSILRLTRHALLQGPPPCFRRPVAHRIATPSSRFKSQHPVMCVQRRRWPVLYQYRWQVMLFQSSRKTRLSGKSLHQGDKSEPAWFVLRFRRGLHASLLLYIWFQLMTRTSINLACSSGRTKLQNGHVDTDLRVQSPVSFTYLAALFNVIACSKRLRL